MHCFIFALICVGFFVAETRAGYLKDGHQSDVDYDDFDMFEYGLSYMDDPKFFWQAIFPGTKWCGDGDVADDYDDLGRFQEADLCCRAHDFCNDIIESGESKHGLVNTGKFTRLHCDCDSDFFGCLKDSSSTVASIMGTAYFNGLGGQCFEKNYPATCNRYESILGLRKRCVDYNYDESRDPIWQWFDVPRYIG